MTGLVLHHRMPALAASFLSSSALALLAVAGTTCNFLTVTRSDGQALVTDVEEADVSSHDIGVFCESEYFTHEGDIFLDLSQAFMIVSLVLGSLCTVLSWALSTFVPPTDANWKALSIVSALSAVLQVPIFLLFEAEPCTEFDGQYCTVSLGVFLLIASTACWVAVTLLTQCIDPPRWAVELNAWKVQKRNERDIYAEVFDDESGDDDGMDESLLIQRYSTPKRKYCGWCGAASRRWIHKRRWANSPSPPLGATESASHAGDEVAPKPGTKCPEVGSYYADSNNSRLVLKVTPDGKRIGDDQKSVATFGDLDDFVKLAESGKIPSLSTSHETSAESDAGNGANLFGETLERGDQDKSLNIHDVSEITPSPQDVDLEERGEPRTENPSSPEYGVEKVPRSNPTESGAMGLPGESAARAKPDGAHQHSTANPRGTLISSIRAFTVRMKRDVSRRMNSGRNYAAVDDDGASQSTWTRQSKEGDTRSKISSLGTGGLGGSGELPPDASGNGQLLSDWNALFAGANSPVVVPSFSHSSGEDDPEDVYYSSEGTPASRSMSSLGARGAFGEDDSSSLSSSSSLSETSSDLEMKRVSSTLSRQGRGRLRRRIPRQCRSAENSVASRTSLLDTTIDEETDFDLEEFEDSDDNGEATSVSIVSSSNILNDQPPLIRTKSAPEVRMLDSELSSTWMHGVDPITLGGYERRVLQNIKPSSGSSPPADEVVASVSLSEETMSSGVEKFKDDIGLEGCVSTDSESNRVRTRSRRRCRSLSVKRSRRLSRDQKIFDHGIHSPLIGVVSDESSSEGTWSETSGEDRSTRSTLSYRARRARVRRLHSEAQHNQQRRRARTLEPPRRRWLSSSKFDFSPGVVSVEPVHVDDYGSEEASL